MDCHLCKGKNLAVLADGLRNSQGRVYFCPNCELGLLETDDFDARTYYDGAYRQKFSEILESPGSDPDFMYNYHKDFQKDRLNIVGRYFNNQHSLLEIGCSAGQFLAHLRGHFGELAGIELDSKCVRYVRSRFDIPVHDRELAECGIPASHFNYVAAFQVLEHTRDPVDFLRQAGTVLQDDGRLFIEVPNLYDPLLSLWDVEAYQRFYYHEAHTHYFSPKSLEITCDQAGYRIEELVFLQDYNMLNHLFWFFNNAPQGSGSFGLAPPQIPFRKDHAAAGKAVNELLRECDQRYKQILAENGLTSNLFAILVRK